MPAFSPDLQKRFKLVLLNGIPQALVELVGKSRLVRCCPLCGCMHQVLSLDDKQPYKPMCQTVPVVYKSQSIDWQKLHPEVAPYTSLSLVAEAK
jgi:hypothetical protein